MSDLIIYGYKTKTGNKIGKFKLQLNPIAVKIKRGTENQKEDDKKDASGNSTQSTAAKFQPAEIDFKFTLDKTGVVNKQINSKNLSSLALQDEIKNLEDVTVKPNASTHKNPYVALKWGGTFKNFNYGQVNSLQYEFTFFDRSGNPLRADVHIKIIEIEGSSAMRNFQSPDITKMPLINDKDNLVKFSIDHYDDKNYYIRIADYNNLASIRDMKNGNKIILPPLRK